MAAKQSNNRVPLISILVITTPFTKIAFDIVGPLPRTRSGYKYILTSMCYGTKYPEAIALKKIVTITVAEDMMVVFSRRDIPDKILTDQGSFFVGKLNKQLCRTLQISGLRTSTYHPHSVGVLERWHASLKTMNKNSQTDKRDWDGILKYLLFAY